MTAVDLIAPDWSQLAVLPAAQFGDDLVLLTFAEVAAILRLKKRSFSQMLTRGRFPVKPVNEGGRRLWRLSDLKRYLTPKE